MISIRRIYMVHTGGTKFYQPFLVTRDMPGTSMNRHVSIVHYGPLSSGGAGRFGRPVLGGQTKVTAGRSVFDRQLEAKSRGDATGRYEQESGTTQKCLDEVQAREELTRLFGAATAQEILRELGLAHDGSEIIPSTAPDTVVTEPKQPAEKPAHWGQW